MCSAGWSGLELPNSNLSYSTQVWNLVTLASMTLGLSTMASYGGGTKEVQLQVGLPGTMVAAPPARPSKSYSLFMALLYVGYLRHDTTPTLGELPLSVGLLREASFRDGPYNGHEPLSW